MANDLKPQAVNAHQLYSHKEDEAILKYIIENGQYANVKGKQLWQDMASHLDINRTWQSLNQRFRKHIVVNLQDYGFTPIEKRLIYAGFFNKPLYVPDMDDEN